MFQNQETLEKAIKDIEDKKGAYKAYINNVFKKVNEAKSQFGEIEEFKNKQNLVKYFLQEKERPYDNLNKEELKTIATGVNTVLKFYGWDPEDARKLGAGIQGRGVAPRIRSSQILPQDVDYNQGIQESNVKFLPIGRYLINKRQLDKDIIAIKRPAGSTISTLPSKRVSRKLGNVIRKVIGGGIPTFDDFNDLDDDEKLFLSKVAKETRIDDKLSIPTPKKNEEEKEINQFEILKGQILAGNDNPQVVRDFKSVILKLSNKNLIPKGQVRELLLELTTLGH